ncbi:MAG: response regulator [Lachnospiraceae bacterium]|nr:response regulator [Lachnospiraceae bacterium]
MYRVLIADDETFVRNLIEKSLQYSELPIQVVGTAGDGEEALERIKKEQVDILITDIAMPFMDGLELIERLQEQGFHTKSIIISGYDEFDYAKKAIRMGVNDYLLKPFMPRELNEVLEKVIYELDNQNSLKQNMQMLMDQVDRSKFMNQERILKSILNGALPPVEEVEKLEFPAQTRESCYLTCVLNLKGASWDFTILDQLEEFLNLIKTGYFADSLHFCGAGLEKQKAALCFGGKMEEKEAFQKLVVAGMEKISASLEQYYDIVSYCALGRVYRKLPELKNSCEDALSTWKDALNPEKRIRIFGEKRRRELLDEAEATNGIRNVKSCIRGVVCSGNAEEGHKLLRQLMHLYASISSKGSEYIVMSVGELVYGIADDMEKNGFGRIGIERMAELNRHMATISLLEIQEFLEHFIGECCEKVSKNLVASRSDVAVRRVQSYIEDQLSDRSLSIEKASEQVHFSVSYLRQIFKEVTGESFNEYLIRKRMEKAGEYLKNTSMKIQDIAENCGYENQRYFTSSFKKFYGCTPTEYKVLINEEPM